MMVGNDQKVTTVRLVAVGDSFRMVKSYLQRNKACKLSFVFRGPSRSPSSKARAEAFLSLETRTQLLCL